MSEVQHFTESDLAEVNYIQRGSDSHSCCHCQRIIIDTSILSIPEGDLQDGGGFNTFHRHADSQFTLGEARDAAEECELLRWITHHYYVQPLPHDAKLVWRHGVLGRTRTIAFGIDSALGLPLWSTTHFNQGSFMMMASSDNKAAEWVDGRPVNLHPGSRASYAHYRQWMTQCLETHQNCLKPQYNFMPTRVIEISESHDRVRLRLVENHHNEAYTALSYCWGGDQDTKTTTSNVEGRKTEIGFDSLPQTLKDAITVTKELGIRFLWVDALCIIQNDIRDTSHEIGQMIEIYRQATVTILASRASGAHTGFLGTRTQASKLGKDHGLPPVVQLPYKCPDGDLGSVILLPLSQISCNEPLDERAWTLQERLLSLRVLEFGTHQTSWNCSYTAVHEGYVDGWADRDVKDAREHIETMHSLLQNSGLAKQPWDVAPSGSAFALWNWHNFVLLFTKRQMSVPSDRHRAISGIVEMYKDIIEDEYFAGMWRSVIAHQLLWRFNGMKHNPRPKPLQGPSWSWISINSAVCFPDLQKSDETRFQLEVISIRVKPLHDDQPYGIFRSGELVVKGRIRNAVWTPLLGFTSSLALIFDNPRTPELLRLSVTNDRDPKSLLIATMEHDAIEEDLVDPTTCQIPVVLLEVSQGHRNAPAGLVLHQINTSTFTRLGVFNFDWRNPFAGYRVDDELPIALDVAEEEWTEMREEQLLWFDGCDPQIITIL